MNHETNKPLISVVLCTYNDEKTISLAINSILSQSFSNFELIIWNDGSTDGTEDVVKSFTDNRIRYFYHDNTGLGEALKLACAEAKGDYIARMDGDDISLGERLKKEYTFLESNPDYVLVSSSVYIIDGKGLLLGRTFPTTWNSNIKKMLIKGSVIVHPASMFRRDAYEKSGGYAPLHSAQDRVLWSKMSKYGKFKNLSEPLLKYRKNEISISSILANNSYSEIIELLRRRFVLLSDVSREDAFLYNYINELACKEKQKNLIAPQSNSLDIDYYVFRIIRHVFGERFSTKLIVALKNVICYFKY